jgi:hypothetical protein
MAAIDVLAHAIYGLQRQMHHIFAYIPGYGGQAIGYGRPRRLEHLRRVRRLQQIRRN